MKKLIKKNWATISAYIIILFYGLSLRPAAFVFFLSTIQLLWFIWYKKNKETIFIHEIVESLLILILSICFISDSGYFKFSEGIRYFFMFLGIFSIFAIPTHLFFCLFVFIYKSYKRSTK